MTIKVGVMDSGVGGLTILKAITSAMPSADILYFADQNYAPYGNLTAPEIVERLVRIGEYFLQQGCHAMVVACNTATVVSIRHLRSSIQIPVVGVEPAVKPACSYTRKKSVSVLSTPVTAASSRLNDLINTWRQDADVEILSSATLAFLIDHMPTSQVEVNLEVQRICAQVLDHRSDTLVLACTHYPLVRAYFEQYLGEAVSILEPSVGVAAQVVRVTSYKEANNLLVSQAENSGLMVQSNGNPAQLEALSHWLEELGLAAQVKSQVI